MNNKIISIVAVIISISIIIFAISELQTDEKKVLEQSMNEENIFQQSITEFLTDATTKFPHLVGIKWVKLSFPDWFASVRKYNKTHALLFAPEPKIASFSLGPGRGVVLAEDFYAPTYLNMQKLYYENEQDAASAEQEWKYNAEAIFGKYGGTAAKRVTYEKFIGFDMGPSRRPLLPFVGNKEELFNELDGIGFFNHQ